ncbi:unnamed protein product [Trichogramma brassicae]|uniref:Integrase catalytic domain-containing protein n=1 Tax=Trichogramma brassicae TaxID=86971 RepID=A0A6H5HU37_9HYME|nr:unnamed protein product [Trichogramma brassicae]
MPAMCDHAADGSEKGDTTIDDGIVQDRRRTRSLRGFRSLLTPLPSLCSMIGCHVHPLMMAFVSTITRCQRFPLAVIMRAPTVVVVLVEADFLVIDGVSMHFHAPDARFQHVHMDLVGPLPECRGFSYLLTMIDRFSRWPEAVPLQDITAETVARAFVKHWVSRFGSPSTLTTDQGGQFESKLFEEVSRALGIEKIHTTPYYPQANGMIERFHRDIKAAFMCRSEAGDWLDALPTIMLGLRTRPILDIDLSPAEMLYGRALRIPGIFCEYDDDDYDSRAF